MATKKTTSKTPRRKRSSSSSASASAVDKQLALYRSMRDFNHTAEPSGSTPKQKSSAPRKPNATRGLPFVIQKHAASHLHYDFRLGWAGVLKSWAIAKGPSFNPQDRRLAVQVEDHPIAYGGFEGIIPKGQYGGGTVMIWDHGTWWPQLGSENVDSGLRDGHLKFEMNGKKMKGKWALIRMGSHPGDEARPNAKPNWLLIKEHDRYERGPDATPITDESPDSVVTGRTLDQIAAAEDHIWNSNRAESNKSSSTPAPTPAINLSSPPKSTTTVATPSHSPALTKLPKESQPAFLSPQLALEATAPPTSAGWLHELKLDGYRIQARKSGSKVQLLTRKGLDWAHRMPAIAAAVAELPVRDCTLDGEVVVLGPDGNSSFASLQASFQNKLTHPLTYFVFDLLHLDGRNPRNLPLRDRKHLLAETLPPDNETLRISEDIAGDGETIFRHACALHAEGIVSKRADAPYHSSRSSLWLKSKCLHEQEFVIAGYTVSTEGPDRIGSLLLGYYETAKQGKDEAAKQGKDETGDNSGAPHLASEMWDRKTPKDSPQTLIYAGRTGTGFTQKLKRDLFTQLSKLETLKPAFTQLPAEARRDHPTWVTPKLVAQVRFATWTADNLVRQAAFLGLREDKSPTEVTREEPTVAPQPKRQASHRTRAAQAAKTQSQSQSQSKSPSSRKSVILSEPHRNKPSVALSKAHSSKKPVILSEAPEGSGGAQSKDPEASRPAKAARPISTTNPKTTLRLTHPEKILDPESGLTKQQLADYYAAVASHMLPHIADRPLSLVRCPDGAGKPCFFQKHVTSMLPPGISSVSITDKKSGKPEPYITLNTPQALISLAQLGVLEVHPWGSKNSDLEHPDRLIFDLDPDESLPWSALTAAAAEVRSRLKKAGLESFLKLTGGKGLHIVAPIQPTLTWPELKAAAHTFVLSMERDNPSLYLTKMTKSARVGKIYLDYLRNERGATAVAPYSPRARLGAHVSLPLPWSALKETSRPIYSVHDLEAWRSRLRSDPWKALLSTQQQLHPEKFETS